MTRKQITMHPAVSRAMRYGTTDAVTKANEALQAAWKRSQNT